VQQVVGAVIVDSLAQPRRVLAARRAKSNALRGRWEFPGGKVEPGETLEAALIREVQEELDVTLMLGEELMPTGNTWRLISDIVALRLFWAEIFVGTPAPGEDHDEVRWLDAADLSSVNWLDADRAALPAVLEELTSEAEEEHSEVGPEDESPEEEPALQQEAAADDIAEPAEPRASVRPKISRRWPRR
jgi:8-oxo-dGTP diphosphatase